MSNHTDAKLLRSYAENHSEKTFAELVRRHVDFVYSAARRMICDPHLAEDVTQAVFVALAKNAAQLSERAVLSGWLHVTARNIAAQTVRTIERRRAREQESFAMNQTIAGETSADWENIAPHLDAALGELSESDRDALLIRYFERKSAREMAATLNISEDAAQKRVNRAVERLREFFKKRNVTVGASGLVVLISTNAVQAAPIELIAMISSVVTSATITIATHTTMHWINLNSVAAILAVAVAVGTGTHLVQQREANRLRSENQKLEAHKKQLTAERNTALSAASQKSDEIEGLQRNQSELLRLRGEVGQMRQQLESQKLQTSQQQAGFSRCSKVPATRARNLYF